MKNSIYPKGAKELLDMWDSGEPIHTIEMGGLGPGYEQAIQVLAIEIVRDWIGKELPHNPDDAWGEETVRRVDQKLPNGKNSCGGFSGAQVGAARWLAWKWLTSGPRKLMEHPKLDADRKIMVSSFWPRPAS